MPKPVNVFSNYYIKEVNNWGYPKVMLYCLVKYLIIF
jgi:hypothetical protein